MAKKAAAQATIQINKIGAETLRIPIIGTAPLITHRFSEKAKAAMLAKQQGKKVPKEPRDPKAEFEAAAYRFEDGSYGIPVICFKQATIGAARYYGKDVTMTSLRQFLFFAGEIGDDGQMLAKIEFDHSDFNIDGPIMREDTCRLGAGSFDLRYRPEFRNWRTSIDVTYITSALTKDSLLSLVDAGGMGGVGEWRPTKNGVNGTYQIDTDKKIEVIS